MSGGSLMISVYEDQYRLEVFEHKKQGDILIDQKYVTHTANVLEYSKVDAKDLKKEVDQLLLKSKIRQGEIYVTVFGKSLAFYEDFEDLFGLKKKDLKEALTLELQDRDLSLETYDYRYEMGENKTRVWFLPKKMMEALVSIKWYGDWRLKHMVPEAVAYEALWKDDRVLVDIYDDSYMVYGFKDGEIVSREIEEIDLLDVSEPPEEFKDVNIYTIEGDINIELNKLAFNYDIDVGQVHVIQKGEYIPSFGEHNMGDEVEPRLFDYGSISHRVSSNDFEDDRHLHSSLIAEGLWLVDGKRFDFSPERLDRTPKNVLSFALALSVTVGLVFPSLGWFVGEEVNQQEQEVTDLTAEVAAFDATLEKVESTIVDYRTSIDHYNQYVSDVNQVSSGDHHFVSRLLGILPENTPSKVVVKDVEVDKESSVMELTGVSKNYKDIGTFAVELEEYGNVHIKEVTNNQLLNTEGYPFTIVLSHR